VFRAAAGGATIFLAGFAAAHFWMPSPEVHPVDAAPLSELTQRLDALQHSVDALAVSKAVPAVDAGKLPEPPIGRDAPDDARIDALNAGNAVVDRALQAARWTREDVARLSAATASLSGEDRAKIQARLSAAINQDSLEVDANAVTF
jgi:hypothetical protein